jgi:hypothetical protein
VGRSPNELAARGGTRIRRVLLGHREGVAGTVYGTIVVMASVAAGSRGDETDAGTLAVFTATTVMVLWVAHVYAHGLAEGLRRGTRLRARELLTVAHHELSIPLAAIAPVAALVLAELGAIGPRTAIWLALCFGVATLAFQGARYAALEHMGRFEGAISVALNVGLGLVIVLLEATLTH